MAHSVEHRSAMCIVINMKTDMYLVGYVATVTLTSHRRDKWQLRLFLIASERIAEPEMSARKVAVSMFIGVWD